MNKNPNETAGAYVSPPEAAAADEAKAALRHDMLVAEETITMEGLTFTKEQWLEVAREAGYTGTQEEFDAMWREYQVAKANLLRIKA